MGRYLQDKAGVFGLIIFSLVLLTAVFGPLIHPTSSFDTVGKRFMPPGGAFPLGTDYLGRDVLAGIVHGAKTSFYVGIMAAVVMMTTGTLFGALAGYHGGIIDDALMGVTEFFQVLPSLIWP